jgi:hypothetical protein
MTSPITVVTGLRAKSGVSNCGQIMGTPGVYEHLAVGVLEEGYTLVYKTAPRLFACGSDCRARW